MRRSLPLFALLVAATAAAQTSEQITVERIIVDARVTDSFGDPITGLQIENFRVKIDGVNAKVESVEWVPETAAAREVADLNAPQGTVNESMDVPAPNGRLMVFLFQTDFARNTIRVGGQMKALIYADQLIDNLEPEDRVAVLSYDSHLKFRLDFSGDADDIRQACQDSLGIDIPQPPQVVPMPSLGGALRRENLEAVSNPEKALIVIANALRPIPGPKSLILFGWGLGYLRGRVVSMGRDYAPARRALESSRTSIFSLDFTLADGHTLAAGLYKASEDTGGFYASLYNFPQIAIERLTKTLVGHYELEVRKPVTKVVGTHTIEVSVDKRGAEVMARKTYVDKP